MSLNELYSDFDLDIDVDVNDSNGIIIVLYGEDTKPGRKQIIKGEMDVSSTTRRNTSKHRRGHFWGRFWRFSGKEKNCISSAE